MLAGRAALSLVLLLPRLPLRASLNPWGKAWTASEGEAADGNSEALVGPRGIRTTYKEKQVCRAAQMPFICSLCEVPRNSPGLWFGAFVSATPSETFSKARKQTSSFVFIQLRLPFLAPGIQTSSPHSWLVHRDVECWVPLALFPEAAAVPNILSLPDPGCRGMPPVCMTLSLYRLSISPASQPA